MYADETLEHIPKFEQELLRSFKSCRRLFYLGWHSRAPLLDYYQDWFEDIIVIEAWPLNVVQAKTMHPHVLVQEADIRQLNATNIPRESCVLWQQGPEHVESRLVKVLLRDWQCSAKAIILETPNGFRSQDADDSNPFEQHVSGWTSDDLAALGFSCGLFMEPDRRGAVIGYWSNSE